MRRLPKKSHKMLAHHFGQCERLAMIAEIIEAVENRCMAADGPVTPTREEITEEEIREIYKLATIT